jgi:hypothetical protein
VAELYDLDMKIYFHEHVPGHVRYEEEPPEIAISLAMEKMHPLGHTNRAAMLLTFDPHTGFPEYKVLGKAYVVVNDGEFPLSSRQVWGIEELPGWKTNAPGPIDELRSRRHQTDNIGEAAPNRCADHVNKRVWVQSATNITRL